MHAVDSAVGDGYASMALCHERLTSPSLCLHHDQHNTWSCTRASVELPFEARCWGGTAVGPVSKDFVWDDQQGSASCCCLHCLHPWEQSFLLESMVNPYSGTSSLASVRGSCVNLTICAGRSRVAPDAWRAIRALLRPFERAMY